MRPAAKHTVEFSVTENCLLSWELRVIGLEVSYGAEFVPDAAMKPNVISAHRSCIDWTPQMYFVGEVVKSLKAELARAQLKCSTCYLHLTDMNLFFLINKLPLVIVKFIPSEAAPPQLGFAHLYS